MKSTTQALRRTHTNGRKPRINGTPARHLALSGRIQHATWIADGLLLLAGHCRRQAASGLRPANGAANSDIRAHAICYGGPLPNDDADCQVLAVVRCESAMDESHPVVIATETGAIAFDLADLRTALTDVRTLLRESAAGQDADTRARVMDFLTKVLSDPLSSTAAAALSLALFAAREALRERLPVPRAHHRQLLSGSVDSFFAVAANEFYLRGWIASTDSPLVRLTAVSPEGCRIELLDRLHRYCRPDLHGIFGEESADGEIQELGFVCHFETTVPNHLDEGWLIEAANAVGDEIELKVAVVERKLLTVRNALLGDVNFGSEAELRLLSDHIAPALQRIQKRHSEQIRIHKVIQYGEPPVDPEVSVIIPLYGRLDFVEQQIAQFVHDPELCRADLIYVLDSPELAAALEFQAPRLEWLYHVPFRVVLLKSNVGYSGANNSGVSLARGSLLLLLNPDVLPDKAGWLGRMSAFYGSQRKIGALGPKLLYEDDALQHAGMFFYQDEGSGHWRNEHYYKGFHRSLAPANVTRRVPAVTGACLMIATDLYRDLGGLSGQYVQGDYEDSDLCVRLLARGLENWYLADVELYHLEGQSYPSELRRLSVHYNRWLQSHLWGDFISKHMAQSGQTAAVESRVRRMPSGVVRPARSAARGGET